MDVEKKHILQSYKNEQEAIDDINRIKNENDSPVNESLSGYNEEKNLENDFSSEDKQGNSSNSGSNVEKKNKNDLATNPFSPGKLDIGESAFKDHDGDLAENPDKLAKKSNDLDRPLPEREINNRVR